MKRKMILGVLIITLMLSGCANHEVVIQPEMPAEIQDEQLQELDKQKDEEPDDRTEELPQQQDEPREDVVNSESPADEKVTETPKPGVTSQPDQKPSVPAEPTDKEEEPTEPPVSEEPSREEEPSVPPEPSVPDQPEQPDDQTQENGDNDMKEDDQTPPSEEIVKEPIDEAALISAGLQYAADTYGYEISIGVRDGYYPAYQCVFDTMEEGRNCVKRCVDDTTRALLARPGTQIVVEIDGVLCRARIDITMKNLGDGTYSVTVYYG